MRYNIALDAGTIKTCVYISDVGGKIRIYSRYGAFGYDNSDVQGEEVSRKITVDGRWSMVYGRWSMVCIILMIFFATNCYAVTWSSNELIEKAKELNGRKLNYRGELITAILNRGDYSWINLNDGFNAIGIWCKSSSLSGVKFIGDYKNRGDMVEANGTFNRACSVHNGELDIHADTIKVVKHGYPVDRAIDTKMVHSAVILFIATILIVIIFKEKL